MLPLEIYSSTIQGLFRSDNGGQSWAYVDFGHPRMHAPGAVRLDKFLPENIYVCTQHKTVFPESETGFYRSQDYGESWEFFTQGLPTDQSFTDIAISYVDLEARIIFLASTNGVYKSENLGETWQICSNGLPVSIRYTAIESASSDPQVIAAGDEFNRVFLSDNGGESWNQTGQLPYLPYSCVLDIEFGPINPDHIYVCSYLNGLYESFNHGEEWININNNLPVDPEHIIITSIAINAYNTSNLYAASCHYGIYQSQNGGQEWESFNAGLDTTCCVDMLKFAHDDTTELFLSTLNRSVWSITRTPTAIDDDIALPMSFSVSNHPNPFNASTNIKFTLPNSADVKIDIYDILGRRVSTIVNEHLFAGYHSVIWNPENLSSGAYFYKIEAGEYGISKKMMLLR